MPNILDILRRLGLGSDAELAHIEQELDARLPKRERVRFDRELERIYETPPKITLIGKTGVGKSKTINALFDPRPALRVGHIRATTKRPTQRVVHLGGKRGRLVVAELPGLSESIRADREYLPLARHELQTADVAIWILKADDRALGDEQRLMKSVLTPKLRKRLVVGINQIDELQPGRWMDEYNIPSVEQEESINQKVRDVKRKLREIGIVPTRIVPYSAHRGYQLAYLFRVMLEACAPGKVWVVGSREAIAPYASPRLS